MQKEELQKAIKKTIDKHGEDGIKKLIKSMCDEELTTSVSDAFNANFKDIQGISLCVSESIHNDLTQNKNVSLETMLFYISIRFRDLSQLTRALTAIVLYDRWIEHGVIDKVGNVQHYTASVNQGNYDWADKDPRGGC